LPHQGNAASDAVASIIENSIAAKEMFSGHLE